MKSTVLPRGIVHVWARLRRRPAYLYAHAYRDGYRLPPLPQPIPLDPADLPDIVCPRCGNSPISGTEAPQISTGAARRFTLVCGQCDTTYIETEPRPVTYLPDDYDQCPRCDQPPTSGTIAFRGESFYELFVRRYHCAPCDFDYVRTTDGG